MTMDLLKEKIQSDHQTVLEFLKELGVVFDIMDAQYDQVADQYGFECKGCEDNCCLTRFYHHTVLEYAYLKNGFDTLASNDKHKIIEKAKTVNQAYVEADNKRQSIRVMCPLNTDGLCDLYRCRPMICRLHGIPNELQSPAGQKKIGPGCDAFDTRCRTKAYIPFDRTPFYVQISNLEQRLRQELGFTRKIKMTIAEILVS